MRPWVPSYSVLEKKSEEGKEGTGKKGLERKQQKKEITNPDHFAKLTPPPLALNQETTTPVVPWNACD